MSQAAAIRELYEAGVQQKEIARRLGCPPNNVSRVVHEYRAKTGRVVRPKAFAPPAAPLAPDVGDMADFYDRNHRKAVTGARKALEAMRA